MLSEHIFFVIERIVDILNLEIKPDSDVGQAILKLSKELSQIHKYVCYIEEKGEPLDQRHYLQLSSIANDSDSILDGVTSNLNPTEINKLIARIVNFSQALSSPINYHFNVSNIIANNLNYGDHAQQRFGPFVYNMSTSSDEQPKNTPQDPRPESYGDDQDRGIVGFRNEIQTLLSYLIEHDGIPVAGIVGMGGSGKTTLAKHIYHHSNIKKCFPIRIWVCISQSWNKMQILHEILNQTEGISSKEMSEEDIVKVLKEFLSSQSCLVILDDLWDVSAWNDIKLALPIDENCKIVVTTRKIDVLTCICSEFPFCSVEPKPLNDKDSEELLRARTFPGKKHSQNQFRDLDMKTALKVCRGLPLGITALAGLLRVNKKRSWRSITERLAENISKRKKLSQGIVDEILELSYLDLNHHLKLCVLYLSVFPEDCEVRAKHLIEMWIAECLVTCPDGNNESRAKEYLNEMSQRYIIQDVKTNYMGEVKSFRIHDLIRQMFVERARENDILDNSLRLAPRFTISQEEHKSRNSLKAKHCIESVKRILSPEKSSHVRSLVSLHYTGADFEQVELQPLFKKFRLLRVLILIGNINTHLPEEIGNLIHLRYLELTGDYVELPGSIENLQNLQTLKIIAYKYDYGPPIHVWKIKNLEHLSLAHFSDIGTFPEEWTELKLDRLRKLKTLCLSRGGDWMLSEIPKLNPDIQKLSVKSVESVEQLESVFRSQSIVSNKLRTLKLDWSTHYEVLLDMNHLKKCKSLEKLKLWGGIRETKGRSLVLPRYLIKLELYSCRLKDKNVMNSIGKSCICLQILILGGDSYMGTELVCNADTFPELENLKFNCLKNLQKWIIRKGAMPNLTQLTIRDCEELDLEDEGYVFLLNLPQIEYHRPQLQPGKRSKGKNHTPPTTFEKKLQMWKTRRLTGDIEISMKENENKTLT